MSQGNGTEILSVVHQKCCGLDIHKVKVSATLVITEEDGSHSEEILEFGTFTEDLYQLRSWLQERECPIVAMESTGVYWRPIHNVLEDVCEVILVNPRHIKRVPGRKTDISDSKWLAGLLRHGLLRGSYIPEKHVREWRELSRMRRVYVENLGDYKRRVHKLLESANIKIDSVASQLFGVTGRNLLQKLALGKPITLADVQDCTKGKLRDKAPELYRSIQGFFTEHARWLLISMLDIIAMLEKQIGLVEDRLRGLMSDRSDKISMLTKVPGIEELAAMSIMAELGDNLKQFENASVLASWSGLCPGNHESAGKRYHGKSPVKNHHLKTLMVEVAWAAIKTKSSYYREKYYRLKSRRGAKRAVIAIAHRIMKAIFHILKHGTPYRELGEGYLDRRKEQSKLHWLNKQASSIGYILIPREE